MTVLSSTRRQVLMSAFAGVSAMSFFPRVEAAPSSNAAFPTGDALPTGDIRDFDFFVGKWTSVNSRLKQRWVGSEEWDIFPNTVVCESRMGGVVNIDEVVFPTKGWSGMTIRTFDLEKKRWSLYWINSRTGQLFPPVVGGFSGDRGLFYGEDTDEGRPVKVVFRWTRLGPDAAHWEQAFSLDGKQWETNWKVEHKRQA
jgi:hypothetical protein